MLIWLQTLFGMNVSDPLFPQPSGDNKGPSTSSRIRATTTSSTIATPTTPIAGSDRGAHLWTVPLYLEVALPMTAGVILLPLVIGALIRLCVQFAYRHQYYWRPLVFIAGLCYLGLLYGFLYWYSDDCSDSTCPDPWFYARNYTAFVTHWVLVAVSLGPVTIYKIFTAYKHKRHQRGWTLFGMLVVICVFTELYVDYPDLHNLGYKTWLESPGLPSLRPVPLTWIPFVILFLSWIKPKNFKWLSPSTWFTSRGPKQKTI